MTFDLIGDGSGCWVTNLQWSYIAEGGAFSQSEVDTNRYDLEVFSCDPFHASVSTPVFNIEFTL